MLTQGDKTHQLFKYIYFYTILGFSMNTPNANLHITLSYFIQCFSELKNNIYTSVL